MTVNRTELARAIDTNFECKVKGLYPYQRVGVQYITTFRKVLLADEPGCIDGEAVVAINRAGKSFKLTLRELYKRFHGGGRFHTEIETKIRCHYNGELRLMPLKNVFARGVRRTLRIECADGKTVRATPDHEFLTPNGWVPAEQLRAGDTVLTNGTPVCAECGSPEDVATYPRAKFRGYCKRCIYNLKRNNRVQAGAALNSRDGYVYLTGFNRHPYWRNSGYGILEHRMVWEAHQNGMTLADWKLHVQRGKVTQEMCIPPSLHIHHKNHIRNDNRIENLEALNERDHKLKHFTHLHFPVFKPKLHTITRIVDGGECEVFDVTVPFADSFVANGFIVHNCGKTLQCMAAAHELGISYLVICPATLRRNWQNEIRQWTGVEAQLYENGKPLKRGVPLIATYGQAARRNHATTMCDRHDFTGLIIDEAHAIKHKDSQRAKSILDPKLFLSKARDMLVCVTGTPIENRPAEIWVLLKLLGVVTEEYWQFGMKYAEVDKAASYFQKKMVFGAGKNHAQLRQLLLNTCLLRRTKAQVLPHLPPKTYREIVLEPDANKLVKRELFLFEKQHLTREERDELKHVRAQLAVVKAPHVIEYCIEALASSPKIVVFAWHRSMAVDLWCALAGYGAEIITGGTRTDDRQKRVARFQTDPHCKVFIASIASAGVGITLTAASHVIMAETSWKPGENDQCTDRCHRVGQHNPVLADFLVFPDSADLRVLRACKDKQNDINKILS